jgi:hypothetical protein
MLHSLRTTTVKPIRKANQNKQFYQKADQQKLHRHANRVPHLCAPTAVPYSAMICSTLHLFVAARHRDLVPAPPQKKSDLRIPYQILNQCPASFAFVLADMPPDVTSRRFYPFQFARFRFGANHGKSLTQLFTPIYVYQTYKSVEKSGGQEWVAGRQEFSSSASGASSKP